MLLVDVLSEHRDGYVKTLARGTQRLHAGQINNHLIPALGGIDVRELSAEDLTRFAEKSLTKLAPSTVGSCLNVLGKALRRLRKTRPDVPEIDLSDLREMLSRAETSRAHESRSVNSYTFEEATRVLEVAREHKPRYYPMVLIALHTGIRRGELLGLQWRDVDFERKRIWIRRQWSRGRYSPPKHRKPTDPPRSVVMTPAICEALRNLPGFKGHRDRDCVFPTSSGIPIGETALHRAWERIRSDLLPGDFKPLRFHDLRHTFATLSLESNRSVKWVSEQLGHRDASVTLNVYAHALPVTETDLSYLPVPGGTK